MDHLSLNDLVRLIDEPARAGCQRFLDDNAALLAATQGSTHNHQNWPGGYMDHITEIMNIGRVLYTSLNAVRPLPFSLSDVLLVCFLHDIEKPWKYRTALDGGLEERPEIRSKDAQHRFRAEKIAAYGIVLTTEQSVALRYVEGELHEYSSKHRVMNELGALCHMADVASARIWYAHPLSAPDPWKGARRIAP
jgi:hypothetical protein